MTSFPWPFLCLYCKHLREEEGVSFPAEPTRDAFPDGVPDDIITNQVDHRKRVRGDKGIRFKPREGWTTSEVAERVFADREYPAFVKRRQRAPSP